MSPFPRAARSAALTVAALALALGAVAPARSAAQPITVTLDDQPLALTPPPVVVDGVLFVPLRPFAVRFNAGVTYDRGTIDVRSADGAAFTLRIGRIEVWAGDLVIALLPKAVRLVQNSTMVPLAALEVLFDVLAAWDGQQHASVVTRRAFRVATVPRPPSQPRPPGPPPAAFVSEFRPDLTPPLLAAGFLAVGVGLSPGGYAASTGLSFQTYTRIPAVQGSVTVAAATGVFQTLAAPQVQVAGRVEAATATATMTLGEFGIDESPLTLFQQGVLGLTYRYRGPDYEYRLLLGALTRTGRWVYGASLTLEPVGAWVLGGSLLFDPSTEALVALVRAERALGPAVRIFGELAGGTTVLSGGGAWRVGIVRTLPALSVSLSYLSLGPTYPSVGNAVVFAGRRGPLIELSYTPSGNWVIIGSLALLRGNAAGIPDRIAYSAVVIYHVSAALAVVGGARGFDDTTGGVHTRVTDYDAALLYTRGPWDLTLSGRHVAQQDFTIGLVTPVTIVSLRAGYTRATGLPLWAEATRYTGATEGWGYALGGYFRLNPSMALNAQARWTRYVLPGVFVERLIQVDVQRQLASGALLAVGGGLRQNSTSGLAPFVSLQYGYPIRIRGEVRVGALAAVIYQDTNANGRRDAGEPGVAGVVLRIEGRSAAISDAEGRLVVERVREGQYALALDEDTIPIGLLPPERGQSARVVGRETTSVEFGLVPAASLSGVLFLDENGNNRRDAGEVAVPDVLVRLNPGDRFRTTEADGSFDFAFLRPGEYTLAVDTRSLPEGVTLNGNGLTVILRPGEARVVEIPLRGRPVRRTFP